MFGKDARGVVSHGGEHDGVIEIRLGGIGKVKLGDRIYLEAGKNLAKDLLDKGRGGGIRDVGIGGRDGVSALVVEHLVERQSKEFVGDGEGGDGRERRQDQEGIILCLAIIEDEGLDRRRVESRSHRDESRGDSVPLLNADSGGTPKLEPPRLASAGEGECLDAEFGRPGEIKKECLGFVKGVNAHDEESGEVGLDEIGATIDGLQDREFRLAPRGRGVGSSRSST